MRIREIIFQGVYGCQSPVRLAAAPRLDRMNLPASVTVERVHDLLLSFLYPERVSEELQEEFRQAGNVKLAAVFERGDTVFRLLRKSDHTSLRLQVLRDGSFEDHTRGHKETLSVLDDKLGFPAFATFASLNLWRFDDDELFARSGLALSEQERTLMEKYRVAVRVENLEDRIKELEADLEEKRDALGKGAKIEEKLQKARAKLDAFELSELSDEDLQILEDKERRFDQFERQLQRLETQEDEAREELEETLPERPWTEALFWAGMAIGVAGLVVSVIFAESLRPVAAVNAVGFGMVAWVLLRYFNGLERASVHQARLTSIKRRLNQVREEQARFREQINHVLIHAGVDSEHELYERVENAGKLEAIIAQLEEKQAEIQDDSDYQQARADVEAVEEELDDLRAERADLPDFVMSAFQLENDLESLGFDPHEVLADEESGEDELPETTFGRLAHVAEQIGRWRAGALAESTRKKWGRICAHLVGPRFEGVDLSPKGELQVGEFSPDQLAMWRRTRSSQERLVALALALALQVDRGKGDQFDTVWVRDPAEEFSSSVAEAFEDVFESASKECHLVLCTE